MHISIQSCSIEAAFANFRLINSTSDQMEDQGRSGDTFTIDNQHLKKLVEQKPQ